MIEGEEGKGIGSGEGMEVGRRWGEEWRGGQGGRGGEGGEGIEDESEGGSSGGGVGVMWVWFLPPAQATLCCSCVW